MARTAIMLLPATLVLLTLVHFVKEVSIKSLTHPGNILFIYLVNSISFYKHI
jgi:hypothetical protein